MRDVPVYALRGYTGPEVLLGLGSTALEGRIETTPFEAFEATYLRSAPVEAELILRIFATGAQVVRVVTCK